MAEPTTTPPPGAVERLCAHVLAGLRGDLRGKPSPMVDAARAEVATLQHQHEADTRMLGEAGVRIDRLEAELRALRLDAVDMARGIYTRIHRDAHPGGQHTGIGPWEHARARARKVLQAHDPEAWGVLAVGGEPAPRGGA